MNHLHAIIIHGHPMQANQLILEIKKKPIHCLALQQYPIEFEDSKAKKAQKLITCPLKCSIINLLSLLHNQQRI